MCPSSCHLEYGGKIEGIINRNKDLCLCEQYAENLLITALFMPITLHMHGMRESMRESMREII